MNDGGCEQICHNVQGSFACSCDSGYTLADNGFDCKGSYNNWWFSIKMHNYVFLKTMTNALMVVMIAVTIVPIQLDHMCVPVHLGMSWIQMQEHVLVSSKDNVFCITYTVPLIQIQMSVVLIMEAVTVIMVTVIILLDHIHVLVTLVIN